MSDADIRRTLANLPHGLNGTYQRIIDKINQSPSLDHVGKALQWVAFAQRPLSIIELQEAAGLDIADTHWDADKVVDANRLLQSCRGLLVQGKGTTIQFAHHTVRQYLLKPTTSLTNTLNPVDSTRSISHSFFACSQGQIHLAQMCATYLSFSDFETALAKQGVEWESTINAAFKNGIPSAIPATLGLS